MSGTVLGLCLVALVIVVEIVLSAKWNHFYFTRGVPVFMRRIETSESLDSVSLESLQQSSATAAGAPFQFRRLAPNSIAFRERTLGGLIHYSPVMRGLIRRNAEEPHVAALGLVNWWIVALMVFLLAMLGRNIKDVALYLFGALAVLYFIQAVRFNRIAKAIGRSRSVPESAL